MVYLFPVNAHQLPSTTLFRMDMDVDPVAGPNELALSVAEKCHKWTYSAYTGEYETSDVPRNPNIDRQYEARVDRALTDIQTKIQSQKRVLDDVSVYITHLTTATEKITR
jgi:hypothetical protein